MKQFVEFNEKIAKAVVGGYRAIENSVVNAYQTIENSAVKGFDLVVDRCVEMLFAKNGETVEEAKARLSGKVVR